MASSSNEQQISKGKEKSSREPKRKWTRKEDKALLAALSSICKSGWKRKNGSFKMGYTSVLEKELKSRLPGCNLKASPHIESRLKLLKRQYDSITDMRGENGMQWNSKAQKLICEDDNVWNRWVQSHPLAKGLRNKQFPYYEDLHLIFGNRRTRKGFQKGSENEKNLDGEEENSNADNVLRAAGLNRKKISNNGGHKIGDADKDLDHSENNHLSSHSGADSSNENEKSEGNRNRFKNTPHFSAGQAHESASDHAGDSVGGDESNDLNLLADATREAEVQTQGVSTSAGTTKRNCGRNNNSSLSGRGEVVKVIGTFLKKYEKHFSLLVGMLGREAAADKVAAKKRAGLNGELRKLPNLNLHARLRAATLIVSDPAKLDLFYSLPEDERSEWVSMLLSGLI